MEFRLWALRCQFDQIHFIQLFLPRHRHVSRRHTRFVPCHKIFQLTDLLLLFLISRLKLRLFHLINTPEILIISNIPVETLIFHMVNDVHDLIKKRNVM